MALSEFEIRRCEKKMAGFMERKRPFPGIRDRVDLGWRLEKQSVEIFEIRPQWDNPGEKLEIPLARATFVRTQNLWKVYWRRAMMKWHRYEPNPSVDRFEEFLDLVEADRYGCFFG
ncbi:MAG: DUF3024 domain-containing protein [Desulfobacterales bacterium]|nr:DUF3024 domain-containing protein [Desulfobacterales bacterium]